MIGPLAKCLVGECASVHPSTAAEKGIVAGAIFILGLVVLFFVFTLLDGPELRHNALHWIRRAPKSCGRCRNEISTQDHDRAFRESSGHSALTQEVEAPE